MGLRQVGKSTLLRELLQLSPYLTLDDQDTLSDAAASAKAFLGKHEPPLVIDEVQKCPPIFDAIKSLVDRNRVPGSFYLTGSSAFSAQENIRESLTGRIGLCELSPMTLAEINELPFSPERLLPIHRHKMRFGIENMALQTTKGGVPVPLFSRDTSIRNQYWKNWMATTLGRDLARVYGKGYDADFAEKIFFDLIYFHEQNIFPSLGDFKYDSRRTRKYLTAFKSVFVVRSLSCHPTGTGKDIYYISDSGLVHAFLRHTSESASLALTRIFILNEIMANTHYAGHTHHWTYFKSRTGSPIDLVWNQIPIKIISSLNQLGWEERSVEGAMKALQSKSGILAGPTDHISLQKNKAVSLVPWTFWS